MIKINLNKTKSEVVSDNSLKETGLNSSSVFANLKTSLGEKSQLLSPGFIIKIIVNIVLVACFPLSLKIYEVKQINELEAQKRKEELLLSQTNQKLSALKQELDSYGYLKEKVEEFSKKRQFLSSLTEERLVVPKILDFIQENLPNTVWLKKVLVDISEENKRVEISGESFRESSVNIFAGSLEQILDGNSITVSMRDIKEGKSVVKVSFDLKGSM
ncbi:MAG: hypothetical protein OXN83_03950 [Oligoflexia bacterium]|nr:hypothetical protein [Oligoflexia bacterium]